MGQVLALLARVLGVLSEISGIAENILGFSVKGSQESIPFRTENQAANTYAAVTDGAHGLWATYNKLVERCDTIDATLASILAILGTGVPATALPTPAPVGYGGAAEADIAAAVWSYPGVNSDLWSAGNDYSVREMLEDCYHNGVLTAGGAGYVIAHNHWVSLVARNATTAIANLGTWTYDAHPHPPTLNISGWRRGEDLLAFMQRTQPTWDWSQMGPGGHYEAWAVWAPVAAGVTNAFWRVSLPPADLLAIRGMLYGDGGSAPLYPGGDNAWTGAAVAIADQTTITAPMDGVIVTLTGVPAGAGRYGFDDAVSWTHLGAIAFFSDDGKEENAQSFSFDNHILCVRSMVRAAGCKVRCKAGVTGTITPWTLTGV